MARKNLYINDTNIGSYGIYISSDTILDSPQIDYTEYEIPARNGNVIQYNNRLKNMVRKFTCYIPSMENVNTALKNLKYILYRNPGYLKIASDYESGLYQYGYLAQEIKVNPFDEYKIATFDLYFSCQPYKYFTNDDLYSFSMPDLTNSTFLYAKQNSDSAVQEVLTKSNMKFDYSPLGWFLGGTGSAYQSGTTYTCTHSSSTTKKYLVLLSKLLAPDVYSYSIVGEVENYNLTQTITIPNDGNYTMVYATPITEDDFVVETTVNNSVKSSISQNWQDCTHTQMTNLNAIGCRPVLYLAKIMNSSNTDKTSNIDMFEFGGNAFSIDYQKLVDNVGAQILLDNYSYHNNNYYLMVKVDLGERRASICTSSTAFPNYWQNATETMDISSCLSLYSNADFDNTNNIFVGSMQRGSPRFISSEYNGDISAYKMNWWTL